MHKPLPYQIYPAGEQALTISFGNTIQTEITEEVFRVYTCLLDNRDSRWLDIIPAYASISIYYKVRTEVEGFSEMSAAVEKVIKNCMGKRHNQSRKLIIPVCYDSSFCLDAKTILKQKKISLETLVELHTSVSYKVFMLGFLPGFAYMGMVDERIATPRLAKLRAHVPAGSIGIAGLQTGIYPLESPGGWNIIGRTPVKIFEPESEHPVLFQLGDEVTFVPITRKEFDAFEGTDFNVLQ